MRVVAIIFAIIAAITTLSFGNPIWGLALAVIPFVLYMAKHCFNVTENQKEIISLLKKINAGL